jgi:hypothetical protein
VTTVTWWPCATHSRHSSLTRADGAPISGTKYWQTKAILTRLVE